MEEQLITKEERQLIMFCSLDLIDDPLPKGPVAPKYKKKMVPPMPIILNHQPVKIKMAPGNKQFYSNNN